VDVTLDVLDKKDLPVQVDWTGKLPENLRMEKVKNRAEHCTDYRRKTDIKKYHHSLYRKNSAGIDSVFQNHRYQSGVKPRIPKGGARIQGQNHC